MRAHLPSILVACTAVLTACTFPTDPSAKVLVGSGVRVTREFQVGDFSSVNVGSAFHVTIRPSTSHSTSITMDDNLIDRVRVDRRGTMLHVAFHPGISVRLSSTPTINVTMPTLVALRLGGAASGTVLGFRGGSTFDASLSGASAMDGDIEATRVRLEAQGGSRVALQGGATDATLIASGASVLALDAFTLGRADIMLAGASRATARVIDQLGYALRGASRLTYIGAPRIERRESTDASTVTRQP
jgi:Putative auto-transporter adhesin, head GIN domain